MIQGAIGKQFVIKHYRYGVVKTKYPDMSAITPSTGQRSCREIFAAASKMAAAIYKDAEQRKAFAKGHRSPRAIYNAIVQHCRKQLLGARERQAHGAVVIRNVFKRAIPEELVGSEDRSVVNTLCLSVVATCAALRGLPQGGVYG